MKYVFLSILVIIFALFILFLYLRYKIGIFTKEYFGTSSLKEAIDKSKITESETPKSIASLENVLKDNLENDFPDLNLNELKRISETVIMDSLNSISSKETLKKYNDKIETWVKLKTADLKDVHFDSIKFHKTALKNYERKNGIATITMASSLEYYQSLNGKKEKIQDRFLVEFIYVIDVDKIPETQKAIGLNCPNCGASIKSVGHKNCVYCGTSVKDITKRTWSVNNIDKY